MPGDTSDIKDAIWKSCELLTKEKKLITVKNIKIKLYSLGYKYYNESENLEFDISSVINKWRIKKLDNSCKNKKKFDIYNALSIPKKESQNTTAAFKKKIFTLECELNKYKKCCMPG